MRLYRLRTLSDPDDLEEWWTAAESADRALELGQQYDRDCFVLRDDTDIEHTHAGFSGGNLAALLEQGREGDVCFAYGRFVWMDDLFADPE